MIDDKWMVGMKPQPAFGKRHNFSIIIKTLVHTNSRDDKCVIDWAGNDRLFSDRARVCLCGPVPTVLPVLGEWFCRDI